MVCKKNKYNRVMIVLLFTIWRVLGFFVALLAQQIIPFLGFFPYRELLTDYRLPTFISSFANFDGTQYLTLVREGYNTYTQAYFPLYFLLVKAVALFFPMFNAPRPHNDLFAGLLVSNVFFLAGLLLFKKYLCLLFPDNKGIALWTIFCLLCFPTSFFFGAVYTEGLFFFLFIGSLYFLKKKNYVLACILAGLSSVTRLMGVFLIIPFILSQISNIKSPASTAKRGEQNLNSKVKSLLFLCAPLFGCIGYMLYLWKTVGDPLFFFNAQPVFGANRSTHLIVLPQVYYRYLKIFFTADWSFQYFISLVELSVFTFVFLILVFDLLRIVKLNKHWKLEIRNYDRLALNLFSFANIILPALTGTFSSIPRYALFSLSFFLYLAEIKNTAVKIAVTGIFLVLHVILLGFFIQGYFVG